MSKSADPENTADDYGQRYSQDHSNRHETDQRLRHFGFAIHAREKGKSAVWVRIQREGIEVVETYYTQEEALATISEELRALDMAHAKEGKRK